MPKINNRAEILLKEIETAFPFVEIPHKSELMFHKDSCFECDDLLEDIEQYRNKEITGNAIRLIHQEMSKLSAKAWQWVLPHYLRFCLTSEAQYNQMETEFLIYSLAPTWDYQAATLQRLSLLDASQIKCLIHFFEWCLIQEYWQEYCPEDLNRAIQFLGSIESQGPSSN